LFKPSSGIGFATAVTIAGGGKFGLVVAGPLTTKVAGAGAFVATVAAGIIEAV